MSADRFIAGKLRFREGMAMVATALSSFVIILAVAISGGFRSEIRNGISEICGDVTISDQNADYLSESSPMSLEDSLLAPVRLVPGVRDLRPVIYRAGIVKSGRNIKGVLLKGTESCDSSMHVHIPSELATGMGLGCGDEMLVYFVGKKVQVRRFKVSEVYENSLNTGGDLLVYAPVEDLRRLNGWSESQVSSVEVVADENMRDRRTLRELAAKVGMACPYICIPVSERYGRIYDWLDLIDFNVLVILVLMILVAGFNMVSGLLIFLFRNTSTIGTLKAVGMGDREVGRLFLRISARQTAFGMLCGNVLALIVCMIQGSTHIVKLNAANYFVPFVPVKVDVLMILAADVVSFSAIMVLLLIPTLFMAKVDPARTIKSE